MKIDLDTFSFVNPPGDERGGTVKPKEKAGKKQEIRSGQTSPGNSVLDRINEETFALTR